MRFTLISILDKTDRFILSIKNLELVIQYVTESQVVVRCCLLQRPVVYLLKLKNLTLVFAEESIARSDGTDPTEESALVKILTGFVLSDFKSQNSIFITGVSMGTVSSAASLQ